MYVIRAFMHFKEIRVTWEHVVVSVKHMEHQISKYHCYIPYNYRLPRLPLVRVRVPIPNTDIHGMSTHTTRHNLHTDRDVHTSIHVYTYI